MFVCFCLFVWMAHFDRMGQRFQGRLTGGLEEEEREEVDRVVCFSVSFLLHLSGLVFERVQ